MRVPTRVSTKLPSVLNLLTLAIDIDLQGRTLCDAVERRWSYILGNDIELKKKSPSRHREILYRAGSPRRGKTPLIHVSDFPATILYYIHWTQVNLRAVVELFLFRRVRNVHPSPTLHPFLFLQFFSFIFGRSPDLWISAVLRIMFDMQSGII